MTEGAFYATCPCHKSVVAGGRQRLCKKEISINQRHTDQVAARMVAYWLAAGASGGESTLCLTA